MKKFSKLLMMLILFTGSVTLVGCHTANGLGQDVQAGGKAIQKAANS